MVYGREGCAYCHTQQVRYLHADMPRFGAPTLAWETRDDAPHLWGTRRIGPDLARARAASGRRLAVRAPVRAARHRARLGDAGVSVAVRRRAPIARRQEARDLVAYLETLGRARELAGPEGEARAREGCDCPDDEMMQMAFERAQLNAHPARARRAARTLPPLPLPATTAARGRLVYAATAPAATARAARDGPGARAAACRGRPT